MLTPTISVLLMVSEQPQAHAGTDQYREAKQGSDFNLSLWDIKYIIIHLFHLHQD